MKFTYEEYQNLIEKLKKSEYSFANYYNWNAFSKCVILRHDIDYDIDKAVALALLEKNIGVHSTYFVLISSDFYNVFSRKIQEELQKIIDCGHEIGIHFDEVKYPEAEGNVERLSELIQNEAHILGQALGRKINVVSMHRPSKGVLDSNLQIPGMINSYCQTFFKEFKYLSDSRRRWREPVDEIITSNEYDKIHLLTHAFWYNDEECNIHDSISQFINGGNNFRFKCLLENITDLESIMSRDEIK